MPKLIYFTIFYETCLPVSIYGDVVRLLYEYLNISV